MYADPDTPPGERLTVRHRADHYTGARTFVQLSGVLELATLEARYSGLMLAAVLGLAVVIAVTALIAWGLLAAAAVAGMITHGWSWAAALTVVALLHLGAGFMALLLLRRCITRIGLDSTCEALGLAAPHVSE